MASIDVDALASELISEYSELAEMKITSVEKAASYLPTVLKVVENASTVQTMTSKQKEELALAIIAKISGKPLLKESVSIIKKLIKLIIAAFNSIFGKKWKNASSK